MQTHTPKLPYYFIQHHETAFPDRGIRPRQLDERNPLRINAAAALLKPGALFPDKENKSPVELMCAIYKSGFDLMYPNGKSLDASTVYHLGVKANWPKQPTYLSYNMMLNFAHPKKRFLEDFSTSKNTRVIPVHYTLDELDAVLAQPLIEDRGLLGIKQFNAMQKEKEEDKIVTTLMRMRVPDRAGMRASCCIFNYVQHAVNYVAIHRGLPVLKRQHKGCDRTLTLKTDKQLLEENCSDLVMARSIPPFDDIMNPAAMINRKLVNKWFENGTIRYTEEQMREAGEWNNTIAKVKFTKFHENQENPFDERGLFYPASAIKAERL